MFRSFVLFSLFVLLVQSQNFFLNLQSTVDDINGDGTFVRYSLVQDGANPSTFPLFFYVCPDLGGTVTCGCNQGNTCGLVYDNGRTGCQFSSGSVSVIEMPVTVDIKDAKWNSSDYKDFLSYYEWTDPSNGETYRYPPETNNPIFGPGCSTGLPDFPSPSPIPIPSPNPLPSPLPSPVPFPSPFPVLTPVPTPVPSPTPSPSPIPSPIPLPSPSPVLTPVPTPVPTLVPSSQPSPVPSPQPSPVPSLSERHVLEELYHQTEGSRWFLKTNWLQPTSPCDFIRPWYGVTCDKEGVSVISLQLAANNLTGGLPSSLGSLNQLISMEMSKNNLVGGLSLALGGLRSAESLHFTANRLSGSIPNFFSSLKNLLSFRIDFNQFSGEIPPSLSDNPPTRVLHLNNNSLNGTVPSTFCSVEKLDLTANPWDCPLPDCCNVTQFSCGVCKYSSFECCIYSSQIDPTEESCLCLVECLNITGYNFDGSYETNDCPSCTQSCNTRAKNPFFRISRK